MKTISTLLAALATAAALFAATAARASQTDARENPYATLPYAGVEFQR